MLELDSSLKDQAIGSSRGGKNTKVHVLINERMQLLKVILTGGHVHDSEHGGVACIPDKATSPLSLSDSFERMINNGNATVNFDWQRKNPDRNFFVYGYGRALKVAWQCNKISVDNLHAKGVDKRNADNRHNRHSTDRTTPTD